MSEQFNPVEWITTSEAAELTGYSIPDIHRVKQSGELTVVKRGNMLFFRRKEVLEYIQEIEERKNTDGIAEEETFTPGEWITTSEAAELTGYSIPNIHRAKQSGRLKAIKRGNMLFFRREEILEYAREMRALGKMKFMPKSLRTQEETS